MKTKIVMFAAAVAMSHSSLALAQTSSTTITAPAAAPAAAATSTNATTNTSSAASSTTNTNTASVQTNVGMRPAIQYVGFLRGPGVDFSASSQAQAFGGGAFALDSRPRIGVKLNDKFDLGIEARFLTTFAPERMKVTAGNSRAYLAIKNVYKSDVVGLMLIPRAILPTSTSAHNTLLTFSPELIAVVSINPKDTRFSFSTGTVLVKNFYTGIPAAPKDFTSARTATIAPWAEVDYQLTPKVQMMLSYWPDLATTRGNTSLTEQGHELDFGAYVQVAKGWTLNPYVATEFQGMNKASFSKNTQFNLAISGAVL